MMRVMRVGLACLLGIGIGAALAANDATPLARGARVGVVNLLDPEVTHFHAARDLKASFLKTQTVSWSVDSMLNEALKDRLSQMGLTQAPLAVTGALERGREECFLNASLSKGLPKECTASFTQLAASEHVDAIIVLAPGLNNAAHAGGTRRKELPDYVRGWGVITNADATPAGPPTLFSNTELVLIDVSAGGARLRLREWGGGHSLSWESYTPADDLKTLSPQQLEQLQPLFADLLSRQVNRLLDQIQVRP